MCSLNNNKQLRSHYPAETTKLCQWLWHLLWARLCHHLPPPPSTMGGTTLIFILFSFFLFFFFFLFRAAPVAYGGSQSRGPIGAEATGLHHSYSNAGSLTHRPRIEPSTSWFLVSFVSAAPQQERQVDILAPVFWAIMYALLLDTCPEWTLLGHRGWDVFSWCHEVFQSIVPAYSHQLGTRVLHASHPANI